MAVKVLFSDAISNNDGKKLEGEVFELTSFNRRDGKVSLTLGDRTGFTRADCQLNGWKESWEDLTGTAVAVYGKITCYTQAIIQITDLVPLSPEEAKQFRGALRTELDPKLLRNCLATIRKAAKNCGKYTPFCEALLPQIDALTELPFEDKAYDFAGGGAVGLSRMLLVVENIVRINNMIPVEFYDRRPDLELIEAAVVAMGAVLPKLYVVSGACGRFTRSPKCYSIGTTALLSQTLERLVPNDVDRELTDEVISLCRSVFGKPANLPRALRLEEQILQDAYRTVVEEDHLSQKLSELRKSSRRNHDGYVFDPEDKCSYYIGKEETDESDGTDESGDAGDEGEPFEAAPAEEKPRAKAPVKKPAEKPRTVSGAPGGLPKKPGGMLGR